MMGVGVKLWIVECDGQLFMIGAIFFSFVNFLCHLRTNSLNNTISIQWLFISIYTRYLFDSFEAARGLWFPYDKQFNLSPIAYAATQFQWESFQCKDFIMFCIKINVVAMYSIYLANKLQVHVIWKWLKRLLTL